jgi:hypothetical protein
MNETYASWVSVDAWCDKLVVTVDTTRVACVIQEEAQSVDLTNNAPLR